MDLPPPNDEHELNEEYDDDTLDLSTDEEYRQILVGDKNV